MTGNKCYLTDFEAYDGGFVSFGDGKGRIFGKGKIKTGKLYFDDVYFSKELKYNLFSVSQMCEKKNNVLFTDTECLILSFNFKLLDKSQVLLRVPRKDNIYSVDLESVVPTGGLTCLFAKATLDESNLWHKRLGHINFKTMNKLVKGIENQLDCKVKVIRYDNGTEFKNSVMSQFCEDKCIKREFSVARTPQQNRVAEKRNRTLIEAIRTMLVDSKLPTTFWAEAFIITCYVLNRALVTKPLNKIPYELIHGRPPLIDFMKPFGCPVTILNTTDNLGKFEGKADEGYFVGYSVVIVAGNQTNGIAGSKENLVVGQDDKNKELEQVYILIPFCTTDPLISQGTKDSAVDAGKKALEIDESKASDNGRKNDQVPRSKVESLLQQERQTKNINNTNSFNTISAPVNIIGSSFVNVASQTPINAAGPSTSTNAFEEHSFEQFSPFKNTFSLPHVLIVTPIDDTGIFSNAYDDDVLEEEVDMNNVDSSYIILKATKFLKDNPLDQVIGSLETPVEIRQMSKIHEEFGLLSSVHKLRRTNYKDFQNYLFACFLSQIEPKKPVQALQDPSWVEAM
nr:ribonuclease H-like domain-containing protein [Tanacetum cinerariifolium]